MNEKSEKICLKLNIQKTKITASGPITSWEIDGETMETVTDFILGLQNHCRWWLQPWTWKTFAPWKKSYDKPTQCIKKQRHYFADKGPASQSYGFSSSHVWMWELDSKEVWVLKNWCFWTVMLEKTLENPLNSKEIKPVNHRGIQPWIFTGKTDANAPICWSPDAKSQLIGKDPDAGKDWRQEKGMTEDEMVRLASPAQRTWVWANSGRQWRTGKPGMLQVHGVTKCDMTLWLNNNKKNTKI